MTAGAGRPGAEPPGLEGSEFENRVSSSQKLRAAQGKVAAGLCFRRQACRYLGLARSSCAYRLRPPTERRVRTESAIVALSRRYPR